MKVVALYHPESDHARAVLDYARDFERIKGVPIELVSLETKDGAHLARLYDIVQYPAIIVTAEGGALLKHWEALPLPLMDEVAAYGH